VSDARRDVLGSIRRALGADGAGLRDRAAAARRLAARPLGPVPARGLLPAAARLDLFQAMAEEAAATVVRLGSPDEIPAAVAGYLASENLPAEIRLAPDAELQALPWSDRPLLTVTTGISNGSDAVSVTRALGGVAETGTLALVSGAATPTTLNLLPDAHIVVLSADAVVGSYEEIWAALRARFGDGVMPRTLNFITGPSRSADIEQKLQMGAHGPRRLHILLVERDDVSRGQAHRSGQTPPVA
jgi:L-lactate dehydrogenase complex protein LldG